MDDLIDAANDYQSRGFPVVPLNGKIPNVKGWPDKTFREDEIHDHLMRAAEPGIGVKMGTLVDAEYDTPAQQAKLLELCGGKMPEGPWFKSRKGGHYLFQHDPRLKGHTKSVQCNDGTNLIVRIGPGAQSAFPPSKDKEWVLSFDDCPLPKMPESLVQALLVKSSRRDMPVSNSISHCVQDMRTIDVPKSESDGSNRLFVCGCRVVEHDLSDDDGIAAIRQYAAIRSFPKKWTDADILKRIRDAEKYADRGSGKPVVRVDGSLEDTVEKMEAVLPVYQRGSKLVRVDQEPQQALYAQFDNQAPRIALIAKGAFVEDVARAAKYVKYDAKSDRLKKTFPTARLISCLFHRGDYPNVSPLNGVVCRPLLLPNGEVVTDPGYDPQTGIYIHLDDSYPGLMSTDEAVALLSDLFTDFPFNSDTDLSAVLAYVLTLASRNVIAGPTPLFALDGNRPGCGKGLALDVGTMIVEGRIASKYAGNAGDDEMRKVFCSIALNGQPYIVFDNVNGKFGGPVIEAALTTGRYNDRILGGNEVIDLPLQVTWALTANGVHFTRDMMRRVIPIQLETENPTPQLRDDFKHPNLLQHVRQNRPSLLIACLSIVANHLKQPRNHGQKPMGSFEEWDRIVRGAIMSAGLPDPCGNTLEPIEEDAEPSIVQLHKGWLFDRPVTVKDAVAAVQSGPNRFATLATLLDHESPQQRLGYLLRSARGLVIDGHTFNRTDGKRAKWFRT